MGWLDKIPTKMPKMEDLTGKAKEWFDSDEKAKEAKEAEGQDITDLGELTIMLNDPKKGPMFEEQFGMDISGAKKKDGKVTNDETVPIVAKFSQKLVKGGYLKDVGSSEKKEHEATLKAELGDDVDSYNQLSSSEKDALLIFISTPEAQRQEAIQKAVQDGGLSNAPADNTENDYVIGSDGKLINNNSTGENHAYTEVAVVPPFIGNNDLS